MTKKELEEQLMKMPELEERTKYTQVPTNDGNNHPGMILDTMKEQEEEMTEDEIQDVEVTCCNVEITQEIKDNGRCPKCLENLEELIHKRMNDINTFQAHENEVYLRGTDEYGKDFQICFDSYNFLEWIDTEHLKYIKKQLIKHIKTK